MTFSLYLQKKKQKKKNEHLSKKWINKTLNHHGSQISIKTFIIF